MSKYLNWNTVKRQKFPASVIVGAAGNHVSTRIYLDIPTGPDRVQICVDTRALRMPCAQIMELYNAKFRTQGKWLLEIASFSLHTTNHKPQETSASGRTRIYLSILEFLSRINRERPGIFNYTKPTCMVQFSGTGVSRWLTHSVCISLSIVDAFSSSRSFSEMTNANWLHAYLGTWFERTRFP